jgi:hypothetical protein
MQTVDDVLKRHEGEDMVVIHIPTRHRQVSLLSRTRRIEWSDHLVSELNGILGPDRVELRNPLLASTAV